MTPKAVSGLQVLVVDDDRDASESLAKLLHCCGHRVNTAHDGMAACELAKSHAPDVILLDIGLPKMDGFEVAAALREVTWRKRPFMIAVTGFGGDDDRRQSAASGIDMHLVKPVDPAHLQEVLERFRRIIFEHGPSNT